MPAASLSRDDAIDLLLDVFRNLGYEGASLADFAKATGLGKSSLYHYFPGGKEEIGRAVLVRARTWLEELARRSQNGDGTPEERLRAMLREIGRFYENGRKVCILGSMALSGGRPLFQQELDDTFRIWIRAFTELSKQAGVPSAEARLRSEDAVGEIQGALILSASLNAHGPFQRVLRRLPGKLLSVP